MASKEQKKLQKRKERAKENRQRSLAVYEQKMQPIREEREFQRKMKRINKLKREMGDNNIWTDEVFMKMDDQSLTQLEHNAKVLKALEEEYEQEKARKQQLNEDLEAKGLVTLEEKINYLHETMVEEQRELVGAASGIDFRVGNPPEVSEVSVIKAPVAENS